MVTLKTLATGSAGNCYILDDGKQALVLEAGINAKEIIKALSFNLERTAGVLITHEHGDHGRGAKGLLDLGLTLFASEGTYRGLGIKHYRATKLQDRQQRTIGNYTITPFNVLHDAQEPLGFVIEHERAGRILFITDSGEIPHTVHGLRTAIIEANYRDEYLAEMEDRRRATRVAQTHLSIEDVKDYLQAEDRKSLQQVILIHGSLNNSDEDFKDEIEKITGIPTYIAAAREVYQL